MRDRDGHDQGGPDASDDNWPFGPLGLGPDGEPLDEAEAAGVENPAVENAAVENRGLEDPALEAADWDQPTQAINHIIFGQGVPGLTAAASPSTPAEDEQTAAMNQVLGQWESPSGMPDAYEGVPTQAMDQIVGESGEPGTAAIDWDEGTPTQAMTDLGGLFDANAGVNDATELLNQPLLRPPYTRNLPLGESSTATFPFAGLLPTAEAGDSALPLLASPFSAAAASVSELSESASSVATQETQGRNHTRTLVWIAVGLLGVLILAALFFLGTRLSSNSTSPDAAPLVPPSVAPSESASTPSAPVTPPAPAESSVPVVGPVTTGEHKWDELLGGECLQPYSSPWSEDFTVVDCDQSHAAQMVYTDTFDSDPGAEYPGEDELAGKINVLCSTPDVIDFDAAQEYSDIQIQGSYPVTEDQWNAGQRAYYCFVNRSDGDLIEGSLAAEH